MKLYERRIIETQSYTAPCQTKWELVANFKTRKSVNSYIKSKGRNSKCWVYKLVKDCGLEVIL